MCRKIMSLVVMLLIISCSKNDKNCEVPNIKIELTKVVELNNNKNLDDASFTLTTANSIKNILFDKFYNIYLFDKASDKIKVFDKTGKFIKSFGGRGNGPGEFDLPLDFILMNDTLYIVDAKLQKIILYDTSGIYLKDIKLSKLPINLESISNRECLAYNWYPKMNQHKNSFQLCFDLSIINSKMETEKVILQDRMDFNPKIPLNPLNFPMHAYCVSDTYIYLGINSKEKYEIDVYDFSGKKIDTISRRYMKIKYSSNEVLEMNKKLSHLSSQIGGNYEAKNIYKRAIKEVFIDKYNRLLVNYSKTNNTIENKFKLDVFDKGIYIGKMTIKMEKNIDRIQFKKDKIIAYKNNSTIVIYNYK